MLEGPEPGVLFGMVVLGGGIVGMWLRSRIAWIFVIGVQIANILAAFPAGVAATAVPVGIAALALLLAPASRRYFRREQAAGARVSRGGRFARLGAAVLAGLVLGFVGYALLFAPDPVAGDLDLVRSNRPGTRVLFVGNTLTGDNSMIRTVRRLAEGDPGAPPIFAVRYTRRGSTLEDAIDDDRLTELLDDERWNYVVLQEHSRRAARAADRAARTLPAASELASLAARAGARTVVFANPGYEHGDEDVSGDSREAMHARLREASIELTGRLRAILAPVGEAWDAALRRRPQLDLWVGDGIRPTGTGSYLTACVLYAVLTQRDPAGSRFDGGLDPAQAALLRRVAGAAAAGRVR